MHRVMHTLCLTEMKEMVHNTINHQGGDPGGGLFPNFCTRVCQRGLRTHTLSLAKFVKKTPFLLHFLWVKHRFSYKFCQKVPFSEPKQSAESFRELSSSSSFFAPKQTLSQAFLSKKHTLSLAFFVKITPLMLAHPRYLMHVYSECPPSPANSHSGPGPLSGSGVPERL